MVNYFHSPGTMTAENLGLNSIQRETMERRRSRPRVTRAPTDRLQERDPFVEGEALSL